MIGLIAALRPSATTLPIMSGPDVEDFEPFVLALDPGCVCVLRLGVAHVSTLRGRFDSPRQGPRLLARTVWYEICPREKPNRSRRTKRTTPGVSLPPSNSTTGSEYKVSSDGRGSTSSTSIRWMPRTMDAP